MGHPFSDSWQVHIPLPYLGLSGFSVALVLVAGVLRLRGCFADCEAATSLRMTGRLRFACVNFCRQFAGVSGFAASEGLVACCLARASSTRFLKSP